MKRGYKVMTPKEYGMTKSLLNLGWSPSETRRMMVKKIGYKRSASTVCYIQKSSNFVDYKRTLREIVEKSRVRKGEQKEKPTGLEPAKKEGKAHLVKVLDGLREEAFLLKRELIEVKKILIRLDTQLENARKGGKFKIGDMERPKGSLFRR